MRIVYYKILIVIMITLNPNVCASFDFVPISKKIEKLSKKDGMNLYITNMKNIIQWRNENEKEHYLPGPSVFDNVMIIDMYKNSYRHYKRTVDIIHSKTIGDEIKFMVINLSQCLSIDDYISLGKEIHSGVINKSSDISILKYYISPNMDWGTKFSDNYKNKKIRVFLNKLLQKEEYGPSFRVLINNNILTGAQHSYIESHRKYGASFPAIRCK